MKNKGFTLIELLATMVILGLIIAVAIPNVLGIINKNKANTYINDAQKLQTMAEYKFRSDKDVFKPTTTDGCTIMTLKYLGSSAFTDAPNNGKYNEVMSYVVIKMATDANLGTSYVYYVSLVEDLSDNKQSGIDLTSSTSLDDIGNSLALIKSSGFINGSNINLFPHNNITCVATDSRLY